jgi:UDP:flavonoid glycosyltransferase YjiC (YdhE family)
LSDSNPALEHNIVIATLGSLGDLHPFLAVGVALQERGHQVSIATSAEYQERIAAAGLGFRHMRPDMPDPSAYKELMDRRDGPEAILRHIIADIRTSYQDLSIACQDATALISSQVAMAAPIYAEKTGLPWASAVLQPMGFMSAYDPAVIPQARRLSSLLHGLGPLFGKPLVAAARRVTERWCGPIDDFRDSLGLAYSGNNALFDGQHSDQLVLAMFPRVLAHAQPDWPKAAVHTGCAFWDTGNQNDVRDALMDFLSEGSAPVVFTLGSAAVHAAGSFYRESVKAVETLGCRAIFLTGNDFANRAQLPRPLPRNMLALPYAAHREVFRAASVVVHQGGIGTLSQALRAGRPMLIVPFSHDQPDNAKRAERLGVGGIIFADEYRARRVVRELETLLNDFAVIGRAAEIGKLVEADDGTSHACDAIERWLAKSSRRPSLPVLH